MKIFELHFSSKKQDKYLFDSFVYEPENATEKNLGSLYMVGQLTNNLPQNDRFLDNLSSIIKKEFFKACYSDSEKALKGSLNSANESLSELSQEGNVGWLGNLGFAVLNYKNSLLNFTRVGNVKILLMRNDEIMDIGQNLEFQDIEPYPLKVFSNIVTGKLVPNDKLLILTGDIHEYLTEKGLLNEINKSTKINDKTLNHILKPHKDSLIKISGTCLLLFLGQSEFLEEKPEILSFGDESKKSFSFAFSTLFLRPGKFIGKIFTIKPLLFFKSIITKLSNKLIQRFFWFRFLIRKKNFVVILILISMLIAANFMFRQDERMVMQKEKDVLEEVLQKIGEAQNYLAIDEQTPIADKIFQECWEKLKPLSEPESHFRKDAQELQILIWSELAYFHKIEVLDNPPSILEASFAQIPEGEIFVPEKLIMVDDVPYLYDSSTNIFHKSGEEDLLIASDHILDYGVNHINSSIVFFSQPNFLVFLQNGQFKETVTLETPSPDFNFVDMSVFNSNFYFIDSQNEEIIKYRFFKDSNTLTRNIWLKQQTKKPTGAKSIAIDGNIWTLNGDNSISRYSIGLHQETIILDLFPLPIEFTEIKTYAGLPYLYILEPANNRIVILDKAGKIVKQYQSQNFDNLKDMVISRDGKEIYLLNGKFVYRIEVDLPMKTEVE